VYSIEEKLRVIERLNNDEPQANTFLGSWALPLPLQEVELTPTDTDEPKLYLKHDSRNMISLDTTHTVSNLSSVEKIFKVSSAMYLFKSQLGLKITFIIEFILFYYLVTPFQHYALKMRSEGKHCIQ